MAGENGIREMRIPKSRIRIPEQPRGAVSRGRLLAGIERSEEEVIVFHAGAGFGKTTAMAEFARRHSERCGWYRMNESDNDPIRFFHGLCSAIVGKKTTEIPWAKEEGQKEADIREGYRRFLSFFVLMCGEERFYVCMDDFQAVSDERVYGLIENLIEYGQGKLRILLTVRGSFPPFLAVHLIQGRVRVIHEEQLRFTESETRMLLKRLGGKKVPKELPGQIRGYTGGWAVGIAFAGLEMKTGMLRSDFMFFNEDSHLNDYIFYELFRKLSCEIQTFLIESSVLDEVEAALCSYALERSDAAHLLEYLARERVFLSKQRSTQCGYHFYPVFAVFLQGRIAPGRKGKIIRRAAEYCAQRGEWDRAAGYAMACGEEGYRILAQAAGEKICTLCETGKGTVPESWISHLSAGADALQEKELFLLYRYFRHRKQEEQGMNLLAKAADKAFLNRHFEVYAEYIYESITYTRECRGAAPAKELAALAEERLANRVTGHSFRITLCWLECCLETEDFGQMEQFLGRGAGRAPQYMCQIYELSRMADWALGISRMKEGEASGRKEMVQESRRMARVSKIYAAYGFYCVVCEAYARGETGWPALAAEGIRFGQGGVFARRMKLFLLLNEYRRGGEEGKTKAAEEIRRLEENRIRTGWAFPALKEADLRLLEDLLMQGARKEGGNEENAALLKVSCLGPFDVTGPQGRVVWRTRKTKELFACLFYEEGRGIKRDILTERLWPEGDRKKTTVLFYTTVSYLRKALARAGAAELLKMENQTYALKYDRISSDIGILMEWNRCAQRGVLPEEGNPAEVAELYHECYMYGEDYAWLGEHREYVEQIFLQTIGRLAELQMEKGEFGCAVLLLEKAAEVDRYAVLISERLVEGLILAGDMKGAKRRHEKMRTICREELFQEPEGCFEDYVKRAERRRRRISDTKEDR